MHVVIQPGHFKLSFVVNYFCMYPCHAYADLIFVVACVRGSVCNFVFHHYSDGFKKKKKIFKWMHPLIWMQSALSSEAIRVTN